MTEKRGRVTTEADRGRWEPTATPLESPGGSAALLALHSHSFAHLYGRPQPGPLLARNQGGTEVTLHLCLFGHVPGSRSMPWVSILPVPGCRTPPFPLWAVVPMDGGPLGPWSPMGSGPLGAVAPPALRGAGSGLLSPMAPQPAALAPPGQALPGDTFSLSWQSPRPPGALSSWPLGGPALTFAWRQG